MCVLHRCDSPACVNPEHLFIGSQLDNMRDCVQKGRFATGTRNGKCKVSDSDVIAIKSKYELGQTQRSLAVEYGVAHETINRYISGKTRRKAHGS